MIQFNLLPDVKLEFIKAQRIQRTVTSAAMIATGSAFAIFLLLFVAVNVVQRTNMNDLTADIKKYGDQLKNTPDLSQIVTIQDQLNALPALHAAEPAAGRTFQYIEQLTPPGVSLTDFTTDFSANTMTIIGQASSLDKVNTFADTLKFTKYSDKDVSRQAAFTSVVLSQFSRSATSSTFTITAAFVPQIFDNGNNVTLNIPNTYTTQSVTEQPQVDLFKKPAEPAVKQGQ